MEKLIQKINNTLAQALEVAVIGLFIIIILPVIPFLLIHSHFSNKQFKKDYKLFLERMNGTCFFVTTVAKAVLNLPEKLFYPN